MSRTSKHISEPHQQHGYEGEIESDYVHSLRQVVGFEVPQVGALHDCDAGMSADLLTHLGGGRMEK